MHVFFVLVALWSSGYGGGAVEVPDFSTLESCQAAGNALVKSSGKYDTFHCVEVR